MKKIFKNLGFAMIILMIGLSVAGCSNENDGYYGSSQNVRDCYNAGYCKSVWK